MIGVPTTRWARRSAPRSCSSRGERGDADEIRALRQGAGRGLQVPAQGLVPRRAAQGPDRQDPQARDRGPRAREVAAPRRCADGRSAPARGRASRLAAWTCCSPTRRSGRCAGCSPAASGAQARRQARRAPGPRRGPRRAASRPSWPRSRSGAPTWRRPRATAASRTRRGRGNPASARLMQAYLAAGPHGRRADRRRRPRLAQRAAGALRRREPRRRARADATRRCQPGGAEGRDRHRRAQLRHAARANFARDMAPAAADPVDGRPRRRSRSAGTSRSRPGAVVLRTPVFELLQYTPQTAQVREHAAAGRRRR